MVRPAGALLQRRFDGPHGRDVPWEVGLALVRLLKDLVPRQLQPIAAQWDRVRGLIGRMRSLPPGLLWSHVPVQRGPVRQLQQDCRQPDAGCHQVHPSRQEGLLEPRACRACCLRARRSH